MITEDYVSFEIAKLLKEKGFNEMTELAYGLEHGHIRSDLPVSYWKNSEIGEYKFSCPTLQMTMKWLREVHKCFIEIKEYFDIKQYQAFVSKYGKTTYCEPDWFHPICNSYEEACDAAIKYCLEKLI